MKSFCVTTFFKNLTFGEISNVLLLYFMLPAGYHLKKR
jgi:hypothetical protein